MLKKCTLLRIHLTRTLLSAPFVWGQELADLALRISLPVTELNVGDEILVDLTLRNTGTKELRLMGGLYTLLNRIVNFELTVATAEQFITPTTKWIGPGQRGILIFLHAGEQRTMKFDLLESYAFLGSG